MSTETNAEKNINPTPASQFAGEAATKHALAQPEPWLDGATGSTPTSRPATSEPSHLDEAAFKARRATEAHQAGSHASSAWLKP